MNFSKFRTYLIYPVHSAALLSFLSLILKLLHSLPPSSKHYPPINISGSPNTGEGLEAQEWENDDFTLLMGTEDKGFLEQRAAKDRWLPKRFSVLPTDSTELCAYLDDGMRCTFPPINHNEVIQAQFVVAFVNKGDDISSWYAVDTNDSEILAQAECS